MNKELKEYELIVDADKYYNDFGVDAIALVEFPAIEVDFIALSKNKSNVTLSKLDYEKKLIVGPVLIPEKRIYRYDQETNEEYNVFFSKEMVKTIAHKFMYEMKQHNSNFEHSNIKAQGSFVEVWLVEDSENDKANALGFKVPSGTWMAAFKPTESFDWNLVKDGKVNGFSIEGYFVDRLVESSKKEKILTDEERCDLLKSKIAELESKDITDEERCNELKITVNELINKSL